MPTGASWLLPRWVMRGVSLKCSAHGVMSPASLSSMLENTALTDGKGLYQVCTLVGLWATIQVADLVLLRSHMNGEVAQLPADAVTEWTLEVDVGGCAEPETTTGPAERAVRRSGSKCRWLLCSGQRCFGCTDWAAGALPALIGSSGCGPWTGCAVIG